MFRRDAPGLAALLRLFLILLDSGTLVPANRSPSLPSSSQPAPRSPRLSEQRNKASLFSSGSDNETQAAEARNNLTGSEVTTSCCFLCLLSVIATLIISHQERAARRKHKKAPKGDKVRSEFTEFTRPPLMPGDIPAGGYFHRDHCPPHPLGTLQGVFEPERALLYKRVGDIVPWSSLRLAAFNACITAIIWSVLFVVKKKKFLSTFISQYEISDELSKGGDFWQMVISIFSTMSVVLKIAVSFFLLYFVRTRMRWLQVLKQAIWTAQRNLELVAFIASGFISGEDELHLNIRYSIHRWLNAAHFFNYMSLSDNLSRFNELDLARVNLLTQAEAGLITKSLRDSLHRRPGEDASAPFDRAELIQEAAERNPELIFQSRFIMPPMDEQNLPDIPYGRDRDSVARDLCLWWVQVRLQAAVKEKLMDKDKLKKVLGALWLSRRDMDAVLTKANERPPVMWVLLMIGMVDLWILFAPFQALNSMQSWNILLAFCPMVYSFVLTFMFDSILQLSNGLWAAFGTEIVDLNIDPILVLTERTTFANLSRSFGLHLPPKLSELWDKVKDIPDGKDKDKD